MQQVVLEHLENFLEYTLCPALPHPIDHVPCHLEWHSFWDTQQFSQCRSPRPKMCPTMEVVATLPVYVSCCQEGTYENKTGSGSKLPVVHFLEPSLEGDSVAYKFDDSGLGVQHHVAQGQEASKNSALVEKDGRSSGCCFWVYLPQSIPGTIWWTTTGFVDDLLLSGKMRVTWFKDLVEKKQRNSNFMQDVKRQVLEVDDTLDKVEVLGMGSLQSSMMKMWWT
ncbi:hypothetical protein BD769DRAFT_1394277 [Suillus cothurnatus]|nr:hypothetical protein BD769DRAFT_1394277 [Suillus cothurnatus]